jgi:PleD family two-component response regulator
MRYERGLSEADIPVVDDQPMNVRLLEMMLKREGYTTVRTITEPRWFAPTRDQFHPDLVLLDLCMPGVDGFALIEQMERLPSEDRPAVVVLTGDTSPVAKQRALLAGIKEQFFLTKPFHRDVLLSRVEEAIRSGARQRREVVART